MQDVHCGMVVTPQNMGEIMYFWKQQNALEDSTGAVKKDENGEDVMDSNGKKVKYYEETSLSFMLAVWKTSDLIKPSQPWQKDHWGAGLVYKMSRGDSKISKQVFWINQEGGKDKYTIDKDPENIYDDQKGKGMKQC